MIIDSRHYFHPHHYTFHRFRVRLLKITSDSPCPREAILFCFPSHRHFGNRLEDLEWKYHHVDFPPGAGHHAWRYKSTDRSLERGSSGRVAGLDDQELAHWRNRSQYAYNRLRIGIFSRAELLRELPDHLRRPLTQPVIWRIDLGQLRQIVLAGYDDYVGGWISAAQIFISSAGLNVTILRSDSVRVISDD